MPLGGLNNFRQTDLADRANLGVSCFVPVVDALVSRPGQPSCDVKCGLPYKCCRFPSRMSEQCRDFITMALEKNPNERPTVTEMLNHPWIKVSAAFL